jgi:hypothetical protein
VALMQLALPGGAAGPPCVHLLRLCMAGVTPALAALLADASVLKTGCAARNDAHKVGRDFALRMDGVVDLSELAGTRILPMQRWSLAALVQRLFGCALPKPASLRTGAWDARELSAEQVAYAALDAWASLRVHVALSQLPELPPPPPSTLPPLQPLGAGGAGCGFVPALAVAAPLAPAKQSVLMQHCAGASVDQIAAQRGIQAAGREDDVRAAISLRQPAQRIQRGNGRGRRHVIVARQRGQQGKNEEKPTHPGVGLDHQQREPQQAKEPGLVDDTRHQRGHVGGRGGVRAGQPLAAGGAATAPAAGSANARAQARARHGLGQRARD